MIRAVFDTNIVVSSVLTRDGAEAYVLDLAAAKEIQLYVTQEVLEEYEEVLYRAKFKRIEPATIRAVIALIRRVSIVVKPLRTLSLSPDESDNRFFECADTAHAHYIVTGNKKHFPVGLKDTEIVNARELIEIITNQILDE